jgi:hypothetical protein
MSELVREAVKDGRRVALLRCYDAFDATVVEAEVTPAGLQDAVRRGPYRFASATDAFRFVQETLVALQYVGCDVA